MPPRKKSLGRRSKAEKAVKKSPNELEGVRENLEAKELQKAVDGEQKDIKQELEIRKVTHEDLVLKFSELNSLYETKRHSKWEDKCWEKYVYNSRDINPLILPEVNAYLTETDEDDTYDVMHVFKECHKSQQMCEDIKLALLECPEIEPKTLRSWMESIRNLQIMMRKKLETATFLILRSANEYLNDESFNMEFTVKDSTNGRPNFTLCLWGNLSKNVRHRGMDVPSIGFNFELPPELVKVNCAVRILHSQFDSVTPTFCESALPKKWRLGEILAKENVCEALLADIYPAEEDQIVPELEASAFSEIMNTILKQISAPEIPGKSDAEKSSPAISFTPPEEPELTIVEKAEYFVVGGLYHFDLFQLPYQIIKSGCWIFTNWSEKVLKRIPYRTSIIPIRHPKPDMSPAVAAEFADSEIKRFDKEMCSAVSVCLKLPDNVIFLEQPMPAFWIPLKKGFTTIGFFETKHDEVMGIDSRQREEFSNTYNYWYASCSHD